MEDYGGRYSEYEARAHKSPKNEQAEDRQGEIPAKKSKEDEAKAPGT
jgi:hypothetical protein